MTIFSKRQWRNANVAVTGINARAENPGPGMAVARCIRECANFTGEVIGLGYDVFDAGLYSKELCSGSYLIPYPSAGERALLDRILQIHQDVGLDAIIPCLDAEIPNFSRIKPALAKLGIAMLIPSRDQYNLRAKDHLSAFCRSIDINHPECKIISNIGFFDKCEADGWKYPLVVKGIFYDAGIAHNGHEAKAIFNRLVAAWGYPVLVQKMVDGDEFDLAGVGDGKGNLIGAVMMRKRALTDKGKAWAGVTVVDDAIAEMAEKIVKALMWSGPFEVEVMKTEDGKIHLIEINPRFPSWIYLSHAAGRNLPSVVLKLLAGEVNLDLPPAKAGTFFIRHAQELIVDLEDFESMLVQGRLAQQFVTSEAG
ncbi:MAG: ATP-grasp domain-containing protein [Candidatus Obscuribacterales bacterium]|nr:ATP-grasp domain-containing protein [Candidatus Obscuribacterales bacterium]